MRQNAEFDNYANDYDNLLRDPMRDRFVRNSDFFHRRKWILIADFMSRRGLDSRDLAWLDVGCGRGELLNYGAPHFGSIAGCDPSQEMVRSAGSNIEMRIQPRCDVLPFESSSFDFVSAVSVYHHVEENHRLPLMREISRVLRTNGIACIIEHNPFNPVTQLIVSRTPVDADARLLTASCARKYLKHTGFTLLESRYFLYLPEPIFNRVPSAENLLRAIPLGGQYAVFARKEGPIRVT
jgi:SAM-dependent methyltransferase